MNKKILQVFYGADALPYKDKERSVHFPIVGSAIQNANNTTQIKFYFGRLLEEGEQATFVAVSKLPNGKIGSKILETYEDEELGEQYALLDLDSFYTQYKGDVFISLQGYEGGVRVEEDENGIYQIYGTPTIAATGSIKLAVNYAPSFVGSGETENITLQQVLGALSTKLSIRQETLYVEELPTVGNPDIWYVIKNDPNDPNKANIYIWNTTTNSYVWVGDNTLDLGEYYTQEEGQEFESVIEERVSSVENELSSVASGSPKGVYATLSDLESAYPTGTDGIYVVSANGHWYFWNGAWTDGGAYLSSTTTDEAIDELLEINTFKGILKSWDSVELLNEYIALDGSIGISQYRITTDYIPVRPGYMTNVSGLNLNIGGDAIYGVACYDKYKNFISGVGITGSTSSVSGTLVIPSNCYYIRIGTDAYKTGSFETEYAKGIKKEVEEIRNDEIPERLVLSSTGKVLTSWGDLGDTVEGFLDSNGVVIPSSYRKTTDFIRVKGGITISAYSLYLNVGGDTIYGIACYDKNKNFIPGVGISGSSGTTDGQFITPNNCYYIRVSDSNDSNATFSIPQIDYTSTIVDEIAKNTRQFKLNKKIAVFGDSIFAISGGPGKGIADYMMSYSDAEIDNFALGGTGICDIHLWSETWKWFDFPALIDAIASGDFTNQDAHINDDDVPNYFAAVITQLKTIDLNDYDIIILSYGANDFTSDMSETTIKNAIENAITKIYALNSNINIVFDLAHYRVWNTPTDFIDDAYTHTNGLNYTLKDMIEFFKEKLDTFGITYIDNLKECNWNRYNMNKYFLTGDGAHFNSTACKECAKRIVAKLGYIGFNIQ